VPAAVWRARLPARRGDRVALVYPEGVPVLTAPLRGATLGAVFGAIEAGMRASLPQTEAPAVYGIIGAFKRERRLQLVDGFERGRLTAGDLVRGNYEFYEGGLARGADGV